MIVNRLITNCWQYRYSSLERVCCNLPPPSVPSIEYSYWDIQLNYSFYKIMFICNLTVILCEGPLNSLCCPHLFPI